VKLVGRPGRHPRLVDRLDQLSSVGGLTAGPTEQRRGHRLLERARSAGSAGFVDRLAGAGTVGDIGAGSAP
jgi:hypothetical protein